MDRLRQRADFLAVANGTRATSPAFVLQGRPREDRGPIRVGFTVTKKNGTATERNRIRRRLRELVKRLDVISMRPHSDYVLVGRRDDDGPVRVGFTVTKKNGTATERNRIRRRLRELVNRLDVISMRPHSDYVLVGRRAALTRDFATMIEDLRLALHRLDQQPKRDAKPEPKKARDETPRGQAANRIECRDLER